MDAMIDLLLLTQTEPFYLSVPLVALAPFFGSFSACLADRLATDRPILLDRSRCNACGHVLRATDLVPILSYIWLRGQCRHCGRSIPLYLPAAELTAVILVIIAMLFVPAIWLIPTCLLGWTLLALAIMDLRYFLLADVLTVGLAVSGLAVTWLLDDDALSIHMLGLLIGAGFFLLVRAAYWRFRNVEGLGLGDVKLVGAAGAWLGVTPLLSVVLLAVLSALTFVAFQTLMGQRVSRSTRIPLGFHLALGTWIVWIAGPLEWGIH